MELMLEVNLLMCQVRSHRQHGILETTTLLKTRKPHYSIERRSPRPSFFKGRRLRQENCFLMTGRRYNLDVGNEDRGVSLVTLDIK